MKKLLVGLLAVGIFSAAAHANTGAEDYISYPKMSVKITMNVDGPKLSNAEIIERCETSVRFNEFKEYTADKNVNVRNAYCDNAQLVKVKQKVANPYSNRKSSWAVTTKGYIYEAQINVIFSDSI